MRLGCACSGGAVPTTKAACSLVCLLCVQMRQQVSSPRWGSLHEQSQRRKLHAVAHFCTYWSNVFKHSYLEQTSIERLFQFPMGLRYYPSLIRSHPCQLYTFTQDFIYSLHIYSFVAPHTHHHLFPTGDLPASCQTVCGLPGEGPWHCPPALPASCLMRAVCSQYP